MSENSKIEWTDNTFNPWWGCQKVGAGCDNCYAEALDKRTGGNHWGAKAERRRTGAANWNKPLKWQKQAVKEGRRIKVFCASMADVFDNAVPQEWRNDLWELIEKCPNLDWQLVTKRIGNVQSMVPVNWELNWPSNVWLLSTIVNQYEANRDIPKLLKLKSLYKIEIVGLSMEPLLGPVDLTKWIAKKPFYMTKCEHCDLIVSSEYCGGLSDDDCICPNCNKDICGDSSFGLDWIIVGGESGANARPMHPDWAQNIINDCLTAKVPVLFKQWGNWVVAIDRDKQDPKWVADYKGNDPN